MSDSIINAAVTAEFAEVADARAQARMARQLEMESQMTSAGIARLQAQLDDARAQKREAGTPAGQRMLQAAVEPMAAAVTAFLSDAQSGKPGRAAAASVYLDGLDPRVVAYITARVLLDRIGGSSQLQSAALMVANCIEDEARFAAFEGQAPEAYRWNQRGLRDTTHQRHRTRVTVFRMNKAGVKWNDWAETKKVQIGTRLIEMFVESTGLVSVEQQDRGRYRILPNPTTLKWLEEANARHALLTPVYMPCIVPPKPWTTPLDGGYWSKRVRRLTLIKTPKRGYLDELFASDLSQVYDALNALQNTAWRINPRVLEVARHMWDNGLGLGTVLPSREGAELPPKPAWLAARSSSEALVGLTGEQKLEFRDWKGRAAAAHKSYAKAVSRRLQAARMISMADTLSSEEEIYFPYTLDFRGRIYAQVPFLNPQGHDLAKGMLTFARGKPIGDSTGPGWLAIHGANTYGYDKASLEERIQWVADNEQAILDCAGDPLSCAFWQDADSPWMFLAFCFEWAAFRQDGPAFVSSLPIALDGSCNGIQHFSAMLRDPVGGSAVNLVPADKPSDIYAAVAEVTKEKLRLILSTGGDDVKLAKLWLDFGVDRKITKRPVMVLPYGGTYMSCKGYVEAAVLERRPAWDMDRKEFNSAVHFLAKQVWLSIADVVIGARECMSWLQACARLVAKTGLPINWRTPTGLPVQQAYRSRHLRAVKVRLFDKLVYLKLAADTDEVDATKQVQGVAPNFVHSMDASALVACVNLSAANGVTSFAMIHDSYGTLAADTDMLGACLRRAFVDMYQDHDVLEEFHKEVVAMLPPDLKAKVPPCPEKGTLDIAEVLKSDFFFA